MITDQVRQEKDRKHCTQEILRASRVWAWGCSSYTLYSSTFPTRHWTWKTLHTVEDIIPGLSTQERAWTSPERLQTLGLGMPCDKDPWETDTLPPPPTGQNIAGPSSVCLPGSQKVKNAIIYLLNLDNAGSKVGFIFCEFSGAFTAQMFVWDKLRAMQMNTLLSSWMTDYLSSRPQFVRLRN